jgi:hypothetical protein
MSWRNSHLLVGGLGLVLFLLQGQYMARALDITEMTDATRMLYRSVHIYLLLSCLANICAGYFMSPASAVNHLQRLIGVVLLVSPALLLLSFFTESTVASLDRPVAKTTLYLLFGSGVLLLLHECCRRLKVKPEN